MEQVHHILQKQFHIAMWTIDHPQHGQQKKCYIAESATQKIFLKFDVPIAALHRLSEIEVAPGVLTSGRENGQSYVIQEYVTGSHPDWRWLAEHLSLIATFIRRYHNDEPLTSLLSENTTTNYAEHVAQDIAQLEQQFTSHDADVLHTPEVISAFATLKAQASTLSKVKLVPIHPDPNTKNILLILDKLLMVDWDDIQLSDPMRDVGLLLWWYVPRQRWVEFFQTYGLHMDDLLVDRIFWWAARTSFAVALWHVEHGHDCSAFLIDFVAALNKKGNPHAPFVTS